LALIGKLVVMDYLFFKLTTIKIYKPLYWARIFITIIYGIILLPIYVISLKSLLGCTAYDEMNINGVLRWVYFFIALCIFSINYFYYNPNRIKRINRRYRNLTGVKSNILTLIIIIAIVGWILLAGDFIRLFLNIPKC
jgi:hypothetical protein